ncbi:hypothetical protein LX36DRAFT_654288 [Colletotrichum falcatum]|nr:hypothetical protein LX36DRAFT_654288 [Colletotrichum falcatum]
MRRHLAILLLAPAALAVVDVKKPTTGQICCDHGVEDPTGTCSSQGLNAYCCSDRQNDNPYSGGCDYFARFKVGRDVLSFADVPACNVSIPVLIGDPTIIVGFVGCAA